MNSYATTSATRTEEPLITVAHLYRILRSRWRCVVLTALAVLAIGVTVTVLMPKRYLAEATVLLDVKSTDPLNGSMVQGMMAPSYMNTQVDLLESEAVALRVVHELQLSEMPQLQAKWTAATQGRGEFDTWAAAMLSKQLDVSPTRDSNLLHIGFAWTDPTFAARAANAFVKAYIDTTLELRVAPAREYKQFFDTSAEKLRANLEQAQSKLSAYQQENGLIGSDETLDVENARLNALDAQLVQVQSEALSSGSRQTQALSNSDSSRDTMDSAVVSGLRADLQRDRVKLSDWSDTLGPNHPQVIQLKSEIAELQSRIEDETRRVVSGVQAVHSVNNLRLTQLQAAVAQQRKKVMRMKAARDDATVLRRDVENAQRAYDGVLARASQMGLESQSAPTNVSRVGSASVPTFPASPNIVRNVGAAAVLGIVLGLALALLREGRDPRVRTDEQAAALLRQPLIVVVPSFSGARQQLPLLSDSSAQRPRRLLSS